MLNSFKKIIYKYFLELEKEYDNATIINKTFDDIELTQQENEEFEIMSAWGQYLLDASKITYRVENEECLKKYRQFLLKVQDTDHYYRNKTRELINQMHIKPNDAIKLYSYLKNKLKIFEEQINK